MYNRVDLSEEKFPRSIPMMFYEWENASGSALKKNAPAFLK